MATLEAITITQADFDHLNSLYVAAKDINNIENNRRNNYGSNNTYRQEIK